MESSLTLILATHFNLIHFREVVELYDYYNLLREDAEAINELAVWPSSAPGGKPKENDLASMVSSKTKAAFTRALNKKHRLLPYNQPGMLIKGKRGGKATLKGIFIICII